MQATVSLELCTYKLECFTLQPNLIFISGSHARPEGPGVPNGTAHF
jgi:hypothetical protein